jgi:hypothetical protein
MTHLSFGRFAVQRRQSSSGLQGSAGMTVGMIALRGFTRIYWEFQGKWRFESSRIRNGDSNGKQYQRVPVRSAQAVPRQTVRSNHASQ